MPISILLHFRLPCLGKITRKSLIFRTLTEVSLGSGILTIQIEWTLAAEQVKIIFFWELLFCHHEIIVWNGFRLERFHLCYMGPVAPTGHFLSNYKLPLAQFKFKLTSAGKWVKKNIMFQLSVWKGFCCCVPLRVL